MRNNKEIQDELLEISPFIAGKLSDNPMSLPKDYFKNLSNNLMKEIMEEKNGISPVLHAVPKSEVLSVPENYFLENADNIINNIHL